MRRKLLRQLAMMAAAVMVLAVALMLALYAQWLYRISQGNRAMAAGDTAAARQDYEAAARRMERVGFLRSLHLPGYRQLVFNRARALYAEKQDEDLIRMLESEAALSPMVAEDGELHFWMGNLQFRRALAQKDKLAMQAALQQAAESYRRSLAAAPDDWDAKYNYELTLHLLDRMRKGKEDNLEKLKKGQMKLLRESTEKEKNQQNKIAPEKKG